MSLRQRPPVGSKWGLGWSPAAAVRQRLDQRQHPGHPLATMIISPLARPHAAAPAAAKAPPPPAAPPQAAALSPTVGLENGRAEIPFGNDVPEPRKVQRAALYLRVSTDGQTACVAGDCLVAGLRFPELHFEATRSLSGSPAVGVHSTAANLAGALVQWGAPVGIGRRLPATLGSSEVPVHRGKTHEWRQSSFRSLYL
jgi:hypothetical protein